MTILSRTQGISYLVKKIPNTYGNIKYGKIRGRGGCYYFEDHETYISTSLVLLFNIRVTFGKVWILCRTSVIAP